VSKKRDLEITRYPQIRKELETLEYSGEIKEFYAGGKELVEKLNIFK